MEILNALLVMERIVLGDMALDQPAQVIYKMIQNQ